MPLFGKKTAIEDLSFRLGLLTSEVDNLKSKHKHLELEWEELYDKVRHQMSRMSRRAKADSKENGGLLPPDQDLTPSDGLDPISRSIMQRRARGLKPE